VYDLLSPALSSKGGEGEDLTTLGGTSLKRGVNEIGERFATVTQWSLVLGVGSFFLTASSCGFRLACTSALLLRV
jgi:hypothetical protein